MKSRLRVELKKRVYLIINPDKGTELKSKDTVQKQAKGQKHIDDNTRKHGVILAGSHRGRNNLALEKRNTPTIWGDNKTQVSHIRAAH